ncbi:MAG TPA: GNAT family protein [Gammaproteobacteria bacterium]|nr:GNAT family protein [Gammaproteobacteria bacterium]
MKLLSLDSPELLELAARWLAREENYRWLDFGGGKQIVTPALLKVMTQRDTHFLRLYTNDNDVPIGIVGLNNVDRTFRTGTLWGATGEKAFRQRGYATFAASRFLTLAFRELDLHTVNTWVVENNPSARVLTRLRFRFYGRQRECHRIAGRFYDRLFFDLLASEHRELESPWPRASGRLAAGGRSAG